MGYYLMVLITVEGVLKEHWASNLRNWPDKLTMSMTQAPPSGLNTGGENCDVFTIARESDVSGPAGRAMLPGRQLSGAKPFGPGGLPEQI
jgi:hypothetical protein